MDSSDYGSHFPPAPNPIIDGGIADHRADYGGAAAKSDQGRPDAAKVELGKPGMDLVSLIQPGSTRFDQNTLGRSNISESQPG